MKNTLKYILCFGATLTGLMAAESISESLRAGPNLSVPTANTVNRSSRGLAKIPSELFTHISGFLAYPPVSLAKTGYCIHYALKNLLVSCRDYRENYHEVTLALLKGTINLTALKPYYPLFIALGFTPSELSDRTNSSKLAFRMAEYTRKPIIADDLLEEFLESNTPPLFPWDAIIFLPYEDLTILAAVMQPTLFSPENGKYMNEDQHVVVNVNGEITPELRLTGMEFEFRVHNLHFIGSAGITGIAPSFLHSYGGLRQITFTNFPDLTVIDPRFLSSIFTLKHVDLCGLSAVRTIGQRFLSDTFELEYADFSTLRPNPEAIGPGFMNGTMKKAKNPLKVILPGGKIVNGQIFDNTLPSGLWLHEQIIAALAELTELERSREAEVLTDDN
jgi:hypothetical protein